MNIAGILLAAGSSTRFGRDKLIEPLGDTTIAMQSALNILPHVQSLYAVTNSTNHTLTGLLEKLPLTIVPCPTSEQGMAASLVCGILHAEPNDGWLIALADMPFIQQDVYARIIVAAQQGHAIVAPFYRGQRGHPVFIGSRFNQELLQLRGDSGARDLLHAHANDLHKIEVSDAGILRDVDYPADLAETVKVGNALPSHQD